MIAYWAFASLVAVSIIQVNPELMYSDYSNPVIASWNWSFLPIDILFAVLGLIARFAPISPHNKTVLAVCSLSLMFCAGLMAISFWVIQSWFDPFWWGINLWLILLSTWVLLSRYLWQSDN